MKSIRILAFLYAASFISCTTGVHSQQKSLQAEDTSGKDSTKDRRFVKALVTANDSALNYCDVKGKRQGRWIIRNTERHLPGYASEAKVEEGFYKDGRKEGEWIEYNADGSIRSKVIFKDDVPVQ